MTTNIFALNSADYAFQISYHKIVMIFELLYIFFFFTDVFVRHDIHLLIVFWFLHEFVHYVFSFFLSHLYPAFVT